MSTKNKKTTHKTTHYPKYHVLEQQEHWDPHTRDIVFDRVEYTYTPTYLTRGEVELLKCVCCHLVDDKNEQILNYIIRHIDSTLTSSIGENQRQENIPSGKELIRQGLIFLNSATKKYTYLSFIESNEQAQRSALEEISNGNALVEDAIGTATDAWPSHMQQAFFKKILSLAVDAYYSHPVIWSEIGYGGPAYPRGYVRTKIGQLDPWEAEENSAATDESMAEKDGGDNQ